METLRLSKLMAERGLCSRREADDFIVRGWVLVDGVPVTVLGTKVRSDQAITLAPEAHAAQTQLATFLLHKPLGYVSGQPEKDYPPAASLLVPANHAPGDPSPLRFRPAQLQGLAPAGRLDIDSTGLIVFTQDGRIARQLIGEDTEIEKEYVVRVAGQASEDGLARLRSGLSLDGRPLKPAGVTPAGDQVLRFVLREGRKRQIRRMCEQVGLKVTALKRVRIGRVTLGDLPQGKWRFLGSNESF
jgi:23S rRNA pseudouridine2604 synthase